jgi:predicted transcriptional regulator
MADNILPLQKLIVLYCLDHADFSISSAQIATLMLEKEYMPYLTLKQVLGELIDSGMIQEQIFHNRTLLSITAEGHKTLHFFEYQIHGDIRDEIQQYLIDHEFALRNELSVLSDYSRLPSGEYSVHLTAQEQEEMLLGITMTIPTKASAEAICDHWQERSQEIYQYLTEKLF